MRERVEVAGLGCRVNGFRRERGREGERKEQTHMTVVC